MEDPPSGALLTLAAVGLPLACGDPNEGRIQADWLETLFAQMTLEPGRCPRS